MLDVEIVKCTASGLLKSRRSDKKQDNSDIRRAVRLQNLPVLFLSNGNEFPIRRYQNQAPYIVDTKRTV